MNISAYIANQIFIWLNRKSYKGFLDAGRDIKKVQRDILFKLLHKNKSTSFGKHYGFNRIKTVEEFQRQVPVMDYEDYRSYIRKIMNGDSHVLCAEKVNYLALSSGTASPTKRIPFTDSKKQEFSRAINAWIYDLLMHISKIKSGEQFWIITPVSHIDRPESRVPIGYEPDSDYFYGIEKWLVKSVLAVPEGICQMKSHENYLYTVCLFLLRNRDIRLISVWNPVMLISIIQYLIKNYQKLVEDIETGRLNLPDPNYVEEDRALVIPYLKKLPRRARKLREIDLRNKQFSSKIIWPHMQVISCWTDSWASAFLSDVQHLFPGVIIQGKGLLATEGILSIPLDGCSYPVMTASSHFYEFRCLSDDKIYLAHELHIDERYEVIITTGGGLYRYNLHDKVMVKGFHKNLPMFEFIGKTDKVSDLTGEKLNETHVQEVFQIIKQKYFQKDGIALLGGVKCKFNFSYVLYLDRSLLYPEMKTQELLHDLDKQLSKNFHYLHSRQMNQLGLPGIVFLDREQVEKYIRQKDEARSTCKHSRLITNINEMSEFNNRIIWMKKTEKES